MMQYFVTGGNIGLTTQPVSNGWGFILLVLLFFVALFCGWFLHEESHNMHVK